MQVKKFIFESISNDTPTPPQEIANAPITQLDTPLINEQENKAELGDKTTLPENTENKKEAEVTLQSKKEPQPVTLPQAQAQPQIAHAPTPPSNPSFSEKDLLKSRTEGYEEGYSKGYASAKAKDEQLKESINDTLQAMKQQLVELEKKRIASVEMYGRDVQETIISLSKMIAGKALTQNTTETIKDLFSQYQGIIIEQPTLYLSVHPETEVKIKESLASLQEELNYTGKMIVKGDKTIQPGSCQLDWKEGGVIFNPDEFAQKLHELIT